MFVATKVGVNPDSERGADVVRCAMPKMRKHPVILVVDDEAPLRIAVRKILEPCGYQVLEAEDGARAVAMLRDDIPVDLLLADLEMPELKGDELAIQLRATRPELKVLYVSGYIERLFARRPVLWEDEAFLEKPFSAEGLVQAVSLLLFGTLKRPEK